MEPSTIANAASSRGWRWVRWAAVAVGLALVVYAIAARTGAWLGPPCWDMARGTEANYRVVRARRRWAPAVVAGAGSVIAFVAWPRRQAAAGGFDGRRGLWVPCLEVAFGLRASDAATWGEAFGSLLGPFRWVLRASSTADLVGTFVVLGVTAWATVRSVTRPSFAWILWLLFWYAVWIGLATPIEWHA